MTRLSDPFKKAAVRSAEAIEETLISRAAAQGREEEMRRKIEQIRTRTHAMPDGHEEGLALARHFDEKCGNSQALRKLSLRTGIIHEDRTKPGAGFAPVRPVVAR